MNEGRPSLVASIPVGPDSSGPLRPRDLLLMQEGTDPNCTVTGLVTDIKRKYAGGGQTSEYVYVRWYAPHLSLLGVLDPDEVEGLYLHEDILQWAPRIVPRLDLIGRAE